MSLARLSVIYDVCIVGAGISGLLLARQLADAGSRVIVLEKEKQIGGRLVGRDRSLNSMTVRLKELCDRSGTARVNFWPQDRLALIVGRKVHICSRQQLFSRQTMSLLANNKIATSWDNFSPTTHNRLASYDFFPVINKLAVVLSCPDAKTISATGLHEHLRVYNEPRVMGDWQPLLSAIAEGLTITTSCRVLAARYDDGWRIDSALGEYRSRALVAAQPPWMVGDWLAELPPRLARLVTKKFPNSSVCLVYGFAGDSNELPPQILTENIQGTVVTHELALNLVIDYSRQTNTPKVSNAVSRLKRAGQLLAKKYPVNDLKLISLVPSAYSQPLGYLEQRQKNLFFCGDSYGDGLDGDKNIISSLAQCQKSICLGKTT